MHHKKPQLPSLVFEGRVFGRVLEGNVVLGYFAGSYLSLVGIGPFQSADGFSLEILALLRQFGNVFRKSLIVA